MNEWTNEWTKGWILNNHHTKIVLDLQRKQTSILHYTDIRFHSYTICLIYCNSSGLHHLFEVMIRKNQTRSRPMENWHLLRTPHAPHAHIHTDTFLYLLISETGLNTKFILSFFLHRFGTFQIRSNFYFSPFDSKGKSSFLFRLWTFKRFSLRNIVMFLIITFSLSVVDRWWL